MSAAIFNPWTKRSSWVKVGEVGPSGKVIERRLRMTLCIVGFRTRQTMISDAHPDLRYQQYAGSLWDQDAVAHTKTPPSDR